ncbi:MAG: hypothetical protein AAGB31_05355, partial [Bdellovibrio sp.]
MKCSFSLVGKHTCSEQIKNSGGFVSCRTSGNQELSLLDNNDIIVEDDDQNAVYFRSQKPFDSAANQRVLNVTESLVSAFRDYGNTLLQLRGAKPSERHAAITKFMSQNKAQILADLRVINDDLGKTSSLTILNVTTSINRGYQ